MAHQKSLRRRFKLPPLSIIRMLWKRKVGIVATWVLGSVAAVATVYSLPAIYKAEALILVESQRIPERFVTPTIDVDLRDRLSNLSQQILSYSRLLETVKKFDLYREERADHVEEEIIGMMREDIAVELEQGWSQNRPGAFRISYEGPSPSIVAQVANQLGNLFIDENLRARERQAVGTSEFLESQLEEAKKRLEEQEAKLSAYKLQHVGELPQQENTLIATSNRLQLQLQGVQDAMNRAQQQKLMQENALEAAKASGASMSQLIDELAKDSAETSGPTKPKESEVLERQLAELLATYTEEHPDVRKIRETLPRIREREQNQLAEQEQKTLFMRARLAELNRTLIRERERVKNLAGQVAISEKEMEALDTERERVLGEIVSVQRRLENLPVREQQMTSVTRDYEISKANYQSLLDKKLSAEMAADMERRQKSERFTMLEPARIPEKPVKPNRPLWYAVGCTLALLLGAGWAFAREYGKDVLLGEWELPKDTPLLGRLPCIATGAVELAGANGGRPRRLRLKYAAIATITLLLVTTAALGVAAVYFRWGGY